jgi:hypothetical protein
MFRYLLRVLATRTFKLNIQRLSMQFFANKNVLYLILKKLKFRWIVLKKTVAHFFTPRLL